MIIMIGVGHVFNISQKIDYIVTQENPDVIGIELDELRYQALLSPDKRRSRGISIFTLLSVLQSHIAKSMGAELGGEMLAAANMAKKLDIPLAFLDMNIQVISQKLKELGFKEKSKLFFSIFLSFIPTRKKMKITEFQSQESEILEIMHKQYPQLSKILIDDRNAYMSKSILDLSTKYNKIIVFVGDAHISGLKALVKPDKIIRLAELLNTEYPNYTQKFVYHYKLKE
ncbi:MAG: TraB/GumN family protein [Thermoplasmata archaeon]